jgi:hypothetical protein
MVNPSLNPIHPGRGKSPTHHPGHPLKILGRVLETVLSHSCYILFSGWGISRYITWLVDHPHESDRLQLIQGALEHYVASTRARREKSYAFPYPILLELLQTAFKK